MSTVARFHIEHVRLIDAEGEALAPLPAFARDPAALVPLYRAMYLTRTFDAKAIALQRTGKLGTFASALGQEAVGVGVAVAMDAADVLLPSYREHAAQIVRGVKIEESLRYWGGDERGCDFSGPRSDFPNCVPIATQVCHAAGAAYAFKLRGEARVAVCFMGDGATSKGDFYEGMNFAAVWKAPMVLVVSNNQWAISLPRSAQSATATLAQKAIAAGIDGIQVDGNDVVAVHHIAREAIERARSGGGPTLIEALTYRLGDHTTADDASRYRDPAVVQEQWALEPVARLRKHLLHLGAWSKAQEEALAHECAETVNAAVEAYLATPAPDTAAMFDYLYATLPVALQGQRASALRFAPHNGGDHDQSS